MIKIILACALITLAALLMVAKKTNDPATCKRDATIPYLWLCYN